jgi:septal ring factor EnvC (AmiA/AmiB activator)
MIINNNNNNTRSISKLNEIFFYKILFFLADILGHEQIDLTRLKKQAQLIQTQIPKIPRITRTLNTLESVLKVLEEHSRISKHQIDQLIQSVEQENHQLTRVNYFVSFDIIKTNFSFLLKQLHESQVAYLKLKAHTASLQSLKECYCRYAHMLDGARTMFNAYQQTTTKRDSIDQVKLGLKECTQVSLFISYKDK